MLSNFPNDRRIHCETGTFVNTMKYYGIDLSEEMVFGIGGGIYFLYTPLLKLNGLPIPNTRAIPSHLYRKVSERLGLTMHEMTFGNNRDKAMATLVDLIDREIPVTVVANVLYLPYLTPYLPGIFSFNGHTIVIVGRDGDRYAVADSDMRFPNDEFNYITDEDLRIARFESNIPKTHGRIHYFDKPDPERFKGYDFRPACVKGIKEACFNMLDIPFRYFGPKGILYMAKTVRNLDKKYTREKIDSTLYNYYRLLEKAGTGGAGYRYMYTRFLSQCGELFQDEALRSSAETLTKAADAWRAFTVHILHYRKKMEVTLGEMADVLEEASRYEHETFYNIKKNFLNKVR